MIIKEIMTPEVECIGPEATIQDAARMMQSLDVGPLPVCEQGKIIGMLTDRDITVRATAAGKDPRQTRVRDVMTQEVVYCFEDQNVDDAARTMQERQIRRLLILDRDMRLVGIVSLGDFAVESGDRQKAGAVLQDISEPAVPNR